MQLNFNKTADFHPNYIVPNLHSIIRCLSNSNGLAVIPDFLCKKELERGHIKLLWKGKKTIKKTLYFAIRKKSNTKKKLHRLKKYLLK